METGQAFIHRSRDYLVGDYVPKIRFVLEGLSEADVWWRPNPASNSIGNLVLHLAGNVRQWVVSGIGGSADSRRRDEEFSKADGLSPGDLAAHLEAAIEEVDEVLAGLHPSVLSESRVIQGMDVTVLEALYHVVEHFSTHTGQIIYIGKLRTGKDLGFWEVKDGVARPQW